MAPEILKSEPLELILKTSGAEAIKCLNRSSWSSFCRPPEPKPENVQIGSPGKYFEDFSSQSHKVLKSSLLELILSSSGAKARKCLKSERSERGEQGERSIRPPPNTLELLLVGWPFVFDINKILIVRPHGSSCASEGDVQAITKPIVRILQQQLIKRCMASICVPYIVCNVHLALVMWLVIETSSPKAPGCLCTCSFVSYQTSIRNLSGNNRQQIPTTTLANIDSNSSCMPGHVCM